MLEIEEAAKKILNNLSKDTLETIRRGNLLRPFVKQIIIYQIVKEINIPGNLLKKTINSFYKERQIDDISSCKKYLLEKGLTKSDLNYLINTQIKIKKFCKDNFANKVESHFLKRKENLDKFIYSIIRLEDPDIAHEVYLQIEGSEKIFSDLANKYSKDKDRFLDGRVGPESISKCHPIIKNKIQTSSVGIIQEPFQVEQSWIILRVEQKRYAKLDSEMIKKMQFELLNKYIDDKLNKIIENFLDL